MPVYFAYGANLDLAAMAERCPRSRPLATGRLADHRFVITSDGYASVRREMGAVVYGLLWSLAAAEVPALDRFEDVDGGLYVKTTMSVLKTIGSSLALVYVGRSRTLGAPTPGYMEAIVESGVRLDFPDNYCRELRNWLPCGSSGPINPKSAATVRARFATPFDR